MIIVGDSKGVGEGQRKEEKKLEKENSEVRKRNQYTKNLGKHSTWNLSLHLSLSSQSVKAERGEQLVIAFH